MCVNAILCHSNSKHYIKLLRFVVALLNQEFNSDTQDPGLWVPILPGFSGRCGDQSGDQTQAQKRHYREDQSSRQGCPFPPKVSQIEVGAFGNWATLYPRWTGLGGLPWTSPPSTTTPVYMTPCWPFPGKPSILTWMAKSLDIPLAVCWETWYHGK